MLLGGARPRKHELREGQRRSSRHFAVLTLMADIREGSAAERMNTLMADIRALGHVPRSTPGLRGEYALAGRLREAKRQRLLSASQLA